MAEDAIVFALANPDPEVDPAEAIKHATVVATGRSDFPNQINNVLVFPGVFRGLLDARSTDGHTGDAAGRREGTRLGGHRRRAEPDYIMPSVFHADVHHTVAHAVRLAARSDEDRRLGAHARDLITMRAELDPLDSQGGWQ